MSRFLRDIAPEYLMMGSTGSAPMPSRKRNRWDDDFDKPMETRQGLKHSLRTTEAKPRPTRTMPTSRPGTSSSTAPSRPVASSSTTHPAGGNGNFTIHLVEELKEGSEILHQRFGRGTVTNVDTSGSDAKIDVSFNDGQSRKLLLKFAKFEIL